MIESEVDNATKFGDEKPAIIDPAGGSPVEKIRSHPPQSEDHSALAVEVTAEQAAEDENRVKALRKEILDSGNQPAIPAETISPQSEATGSVVNEMEIPDEIYNLPEVLYMVRQKRSSDPVLTKLESDIEEVEYALAEVKRLWWPGPREFLRRLGPNSSVGNPEDAEFEETRSKMEAYLPVLRDKRDRRIAEIRRAAALEYVDNVSKPKSEPGSSRNEAADVAAIEKDPEVTRLRDELKKNKRRIFFKNLRDNVMKSLYYTYQNDEVDGLRKEASDLQARLESKRAEVKVKLQQNDKIDTNI